MYNFVAESFRKVQKFCETTCNLEDFSVSGLRQFSASGGSGFCMDIDIILGAAQLSRNSIQMYISKHEGQSAQLVQENLSKCITSVPHSYIVSVSLYSLSIGYRFRS